MPTSTPPKTSSNPTPTSTLSPPSSSLTYTVSSTSSRTSSIPSVVTPANQQIQASPLSSQPATTTAKRKTKSSVPITPEQARNDFLQAELAAAQARIVQLDAAIKEKDERVAVLMARIKIFEDENTKNLHDKYFPRSTAAGNPPDPGSRGPPPPPTNQQCSSPPYPCGGHCTSTCCHFNHRLSHQYQYHPDSLQVQELHHIKERIDDLHKITISLQSSVTSLEKYRLSTSPPSVPTSLATDDQGLTSEASPPTKTDNADISFASIEEFMENTDECIATDVIPNSLNSLAPTTQQH